MPSSFQWKNQCWNVFSCLSMRLTVVSLTILKLVWPFSPAVAGTRYMWEAAITPRWSYNRYIRSKDGGGMSKSSGVLQGLKLNMKKVKRLMKMRCRQGKMKSRMRIVLLKTLKNKTWYGHSGRNIACSTSWNNLHRHLARQAQKKSQKTVRI